jgi:hypothetical protein
MNDSHTFSSWRSYVMRLDWSNRHDASYKAQIKAVLFDLTFDDTAHDIAELMLKAGRSPTPTELSDQWPRAVAFVHGNEQALQSSPRVRLTPFKRAIQPPPFDPKILASFAEPTNSISDIRQFLINRSPEPVNVLPGEFIHQVFGDKIAIVCDHFKSNGIVAKHDDDLEFLNLLVSGTDRNNPDGAWFLSNPVDGLLHENASGKLSARSEPCITDFRHIVCESDHADPDQWLRAWSQIRLPIISITESGNPESCAHVLIMINAKSKQHWDEIADKHFKQGLLPTIGADTKTMSAVRLTRLPNVNRLSKGGFQRLLYLNPSPDSTPIFP